MRRTYRNNDWTLADRACVAVEWVVALGASAFLLWVVFTSTA